MAGERGIEHAARSEAWLRETLEEIVGQIRRLLDVTGISFLVVDWERSFIEPAASWFASDEVREAFGPVLSRPYEPARAGVTEAAIEGGSPVLIEHIGDWPGAEGLHERLQERLDPDAAQRLWDWYSSSSFLSVPVQVRSRGRILGVLAIARSLPQPAFSSGEKRIVEVFADLAAVALERSELLDREERRARDEELLNRASQEAARSLDLDEVSRAIAEQAAVLSGAVLARLLRLEPATATLREVARAGAELAEGGAGGPAQAPGDSPPQTPGDGPPQAPHDGPPQTPGDGSPQAPHDGPPEPSAGAAARAAQTGEPVLGDHEAHVPIVLGPRVFGVISATAGDAGFAPGGPDRLSAFALVAAAAIANALDYERERRVSRAMTAGFVPQRPPRLEDHEVGFVYEPAGRQAGGGDVFGMWTLPGGALGLLVGDVSGKGLEVAATAAMVRFFVEARTFDCPRPAQVLAQTNAILRGRLPEDLFVPAFLAIVEGRRLRWCNAGHPAPHLLRASGGTTALPGTGLPLGVLEDGGYYEQEAELLPGDVLVAATDGLWEARREGVQFGDARLEPLLAEHGRTLPPDQLVRRLHEEAERWAPQLHDDIVVLAMRVRR